MHPHDPEAITSRYRLSLLSCCKLVKNSLQGCCGFWPFGIAISLKAAALGSGSREPAFFARLAEESGRFAGQEVAINAFLQSDPAFIALCHWNANIDNAFFWRGEDGPLECGLMDWGRAGRMNVAFAIWGSLSAAHHDIWEHHLDDLLLLFAKTLAREGGPRLPVSVLRLHLELYAGIMGLSYFLDCPARIRNAVPTVMTAAGIRDPVVEGHEHVRNQLHIATVVLNLWRRRGLGALLDSLSHQTAGHAGS